MTPQPETAARRMQRLLAMVPWIAAHDGPRLDDVCKRFDIDRRQLAADLDVVWLVGLPPYTPDVLIDVVQEGERVWIHYADVFARPNRLTPEQALALLSAGASLLALPGADQDGPLASGVAKLAQVLGLDAGQVLDIHLGDASVVVVEMLQMALREERRVRLDYYSYGRDTRTVREVNPYVMHAAEGSLYLLGYCHLAQADRRFRIDRIASVEVLDDSFEVPAEAPSSTLFQPDEGDPRVVLRLAPGAAWVVDAYPVEKVERLHGGLLEVTLAIAAEPWLERLLLSLGPDANVVSAPPELVDAGKRAGERILARYR